MAQFGLAPQGKRNILHLPGHLALQAMREGQGVGMVARLFIEEDLRTGRLVALFDDETEGDGVGYHLVRRPGRMRDDLAAFVGWLRREGRRDAERRGSEARASRECG
jgi:LysR family glycine cleavage system transcriptional activator